MNMKVNDLKKNKIVNIILKLVSAWVLISVLLDLITGGFVDFVDDWIVYNPGILFSPQQMGSLVGLLFVVLLTYLSYRFFKWSWSDILKREKNEKTT